MTPPTPQGHQNCMAHMAKHIISQPGPAIVTFYVRGPTQRWESSMSPGIWARAHSNPLCLLWTGCLCLPKIHLLNYNFQ